MKIVIEYQGNRYESDENNEQTADEVSEAIYENFSDMKKLKLKLSDGSSILLGESALKSSVIMFVP